MSEATTGTIEVSIETDNISENNVTTTEKLVEKSFSPEIVNRYKEMQAEIERTNEKLKWLNEQMFSSPQQIQFEVSELQLTIQQNPNFLDHTSELSVSQKELLSGLIATKNLPGNFKNYILPVFTKDSELVKESFTNSIKVAVNNIASANFNRTIEIVKQAAIATGFNSGSNVLKNTPTEQNVVFANLIGQKFTAFCKISKNGNPIIALDLEGYSYDDQACSRTMDEIISYLTSHGLNLSYKRILHHQPQGVLRNLVSKGKVVTGPAIAFEMNSVKTIRKTLQRPKNRN